MNSKDYHDYVIREGQLVGDFEGMYRHADGIPWHQDEQSGWVDVKICMELLKRYAPFNYIYDIGSGLGYFADLLHKNLGSESCIISGFDLSETACSRASSLFPQYFFRKLDITSKSMPVQNLNQGLYSFRGVLWYVTDHIHNVVNNICSLIPEGSIFLLSQNFPPLDTDFVGKKVVDSPDALEELFVNKLKLLKKVYYSDLESKSNDNWYIGIFQKR